MHQRHCLSVLREEPAIRNVHQLQLARIVIQLQRHRVDILRARNQDVDRESRALRLSDRSWIEQETGSCARRGGRRGRRIRSSRDWRRWTNLSARRRSLRCSRRRSAAVPFAVGAYITAAYWFTASTSFANPAVTIARSASDTFAGIRPADVLGFIVAQMLGAMTATWLFHWLVPAISEVAPEVLMQHGDTERSRGQGRPRH